MYPPAPQLTCQVLLAYFQPVQKVCYPLVWTVYYPYIVYLHLRPKKRPRLVQVTGSSSRHLTGVLF
jgi:hypothetical protein|nr:MAG TPA: hypothetical protein [Caudoviricetes sp.]